MNSFQQEYLGTFECPNKELYDLAKKYHDFCEEFDKLCCSFVNERNVAIPTTYKELSLINKHALEVKKILIKEGNCKGYSSLEIMKAIKNYRR